MSDTTTVEDQKVIGGSGQNIPAKSKSDKNDPSMQVLVHSPFREYYNGLAISLTAENATGEFDILAHHHNFISLLQPCNLIIRTVNAGDLKVQISGGLLHVKADQVIVFLDI